MSGKRITIAEILTGNGYSARKVDYIDSAIINKLEMRYNYDRDRLIGDNVAIAALEAEICKIFNEPDYKQNMDVANEIHLFLMGKNIVKEEPILSIKERKLLVSSGETVGPKNPYARDGVVYVESNEGGALVVEVADVVATETVYQPESEAQTPSEETIVKEEVKKEVVAEIVAKVEEEVIVEEEVKEEVKKEVVAEIVAKEVVVEIVAKVEEEVIVEEEVKKEVPTEKVAVEVVVEPTTKEEKTSTKTKPKTIKTSPSKNI